MDYVKLWTTVHDDPDLRRLSDKAFRQYVYAWSWCGAHETDGIYDTIAGLVSPKVLTELIDKGKLLRVDDDHFAIRGWGKRQITIAELAKRRAAGKAAADARWNAERNANRIAERIQIPDAEEQGKEQDITSRRDRHPDAEPLCVLLADLIEANGSKRPTITERWREEADRMLRIDERPRDEAEALIRWSQADTFWRANVLSMVKFRAKYDALRLRRDESVIEPEPADWSDAARRIAAEEAALKEAVRG